MKLWNRSLFIALGLCPLLSTSVIARQQRFQESEGNRMLDLDYSLVIEATEDPNFFGFYSPDLEGFTGIGHSVEDCLYKARWGMREHVDLLREQNLPVPDKTEQPTVLVRDESKAA